MRDGCIAASDLGACGEGGTLEKVPKGTIGAMTERGALFDNRWPSQQCPRLNTDLPARHAAVADVALRHALPYY